MADGQLAGHWRRRSASAASPVDVEVLLLRDLTAVESGALERNVEAYGDFVGRPVGLRLLPTD